MSANARRPQRAFNREIRSRISTAGSSSARTETARRISGRQLHCVRRPVHAGPRDHVTSWRRQYGAGQTRSRRHCQPLPPIDHRRLSPGAHQNVKQQRSAPGYRPFSTQPAHRSAEGSRRRVAVRNSRLRHDLQYVSDAVRWLVAARCFSLPERRRLSPTWRSEHAESNTEMRQLSVSSYRALVNTQLFAKT